MNETSIMVSDRRRWSVRDISTIAILSVNILGFVWGASKMDSSISSLQKAVEELTRTTQTLNTKLAGIELNFETRISVLETKVDQLTGGVK